MNFPERLRKLREQMAADGVAAVIITTTDPHQSEAVAEHWKELQWFTGFTGSYGNCVVTPDAVAFWTDGRYVLQAKNQLGENGIEQYCVNVLSDPTYTDWILSHTKVGDRVALDGRVLSISGFRTLAQKLEKNQLEVAYAKDYVGIIWGAQRPAIPDKSLFDLSLQYAGEDRPSKISRLRAAMAQKGADVYLTCSLDDIGWFTNLRGFELPRLPIFHAYLLVTPGRVEVFVGLSKITPEVRAALAEDGLTLREMDEIFDAVAALSTGHKVYLDPFKTGLLLYNLIPAGNKILEGLDLLTFMKSQKNEMEKENLRKANTYEAVALTRLIKYIKDHVDGGELDEYHLGLHLEDYRTRFPSYLMPGNVPIVAYQANAALAHYRPSESDTTRLKPEGFFLFDVCAHFFEGTTDITRTVVCGPLTQEMGHDYTITLKSHIALASQRFPYGTTGPALDAIVKKVHWDCGLHYTHGTGHGLGYLLDIHDGPCRIGIQPSSAFPYGTEVPLEAGMLFSNEPGVYKGGRFGIRLENDVLVEEDMQNEFARFLRFETLTYCPFDRAAIVVEMLTQGERDWLNDYHKKTFEKLSPFMEEEEKAWLREQTAAI